MPSRLVFYWPTPKPAKQSRPWLSSHLVVQEIRPKIRQLYLDSHPFNFSFTLGISMLRSSIMDSQNWLLLTDYASKYRISVSTLRRRIKSHQIPFRFENGKYFLIDAAPDVTSEANSVGAIVGKAETALANRPQSTEPMMALPLKDLDLPETKLAEAELEEVAAKDGPIMSTATKLLNELKHAYMNILHEKEEQMIQLKEEVSDLKTLVRVLEEDNDRLRSLLGFKNPNN